jgi:hypothetical protein
MRDAVSLIGKKIKMGEKTYIINNIHFLPSPVQPQNYIWFGLENNGTVVNHSYENLLPYLQEQIKL